MTLIIFHWCEKQKWNQHFCRISYNNFIQGQATFDIGEYIPEYLKNLLQLHLKNWSILILRSQGQGSDWPGTINIAYTIPGNPLLIDPSVSCEEVASFNITYNTMCSRSIKYF